MVPLSKATYVVDIMEAYDQAPYIVKGKKYIYHINAWISDADGFQETESKWVQTEYGDESIFEPPSLTFRHHSSLSTPTVSLQKMPEPSYQINPLSESTMLNVVNMGTGSVTFPTEVQKPIVKEISIFDESKVQKAIIKVSLLKSN